MKNISLIDTATSLVGLYDKTKKTASVLCELKEVKHQEVEQLPFSLSARIQDVVEAFDDAAFLVMDLAQKVLSYASGLEEARLTVVRSDDSETGGVPPSEHRGA